ncbi:MAG TPA: hypothetical protein VJY33_02025 [Isosphaeraceae bacterium]|nr:hypothetical protein [Isosphaeraceae bacterium]
MTTRDVPGARLFAAIVRFCSAAAAAQIALASKAALDVSPGLAANDTGRS